MTTIVSAPLLSSPLRAVCVDAGARLTGFAGWELPLQFQGLVQEHLAVRQQVGIFDISHMGKFQLRGSGLREALQRLLPSDLTTLLPGQAQYSVLLNDAGGCLDDLIVYWQGWVDGAEQALLIVNAATTESDRRWLTEHLPPAIALLDLSQELALVAIQGPQAIAALQPFVSCELAELPRFGHTVTSIAGQPAFVARTGYTGEDGCEVMLPPEAAIALWQQLTAAGVTPCGLGARDTLRLEAAMPLYGHELDSETTPLEAGLGWVVHLDRNLEFIGRDRLVQAKKEGLRRRLVGLTLPGRNIARHGYPVAIADTTIGIVTSGSWSPTLSQAIALAYVPPALANLGQELWVEIRGKQIPATVVKRPFYRGSQFR
ncbi:glycine cleavage system aminomethyltransferase GcvT [Synechococcus elongatus PCC 11802]|uniref:Aminomethyltransferase n=1 Tax=Synechococcus elongatus PCC 11802 TaxID=2283154 RepID=A0AAU6R5C2_SYNEL|nr:glycine cleavage system aminomethyltransferase GcvT [Synechococcus elongatus]QFZ91835.1 glycine cleavage system aminomethyltransferase GcvT [Synechococcus elongatus PCC 11802]